MAADRLKVGLDTSCLVPLICSWHAFHATTAAECERLRRQNVQLVVAVHALMECFSVLTRMPMPYRFSPGEAERLVIENFSKDSEIPGIDSAIVWSAIRDLALRELYGGRIHDAIIALCTARAGATVLLTWNVRDFLSIAPPGLEIRQPGFRYQ